MWLMNGKTASSNTIVGSASGWTLRGVGAD